MLTKILCFVQNKSFTIIIHLSNGKLRSVKNVFYPYLCRTGHTNTPKLNLCPRCCQKCSIKFNLITSNVCCQIVLVPNCPVPNCPGPGLLVPNCAGAKLSVFVILVPNCPAPNYPVPICPTICP